MRMFNGLLKELKKGAVITITENGAYNYIESYEKLENGKFKYEEYAQISLEELEEILEYAWGDSDFGIRVKR